MNKFKTYIFVIIFLIFSYAYSKEIIHIVSASIDYITNQESEKLLTESKINFDDTVIVKNKSNKQNFF